jgi:hypothetical protein
MPELVLGAACQSSASCTNLRRHFFWKSSRSNSGAIRTQYEQDDARLNDQEIQRQLSLLRQQKNQPLNMRLNEEIDADGYAAKATEHQDREANFKLKLNAGDLGLDENAEIAIKAF